MIGIVSFVLILPEFIKWCKVKNLTPHNLINRSIMSLCVCLDPRVGRRLLVHCIYFSTLSRRHWSHNKLTSFFCNNYGYESCDWACHYGLISLTMTQLNTWIPDNMLYIIVPWYRFCQYTEREGNRGEIRK